MSTHGKIDPDAGGRFLMELLAEDEAERLDSLSDEEFLAERKAKGRDARPTPSAEELIAKVKARAARQPESGSRRVAPDPSGIRVAQASDAAALVEPIAPRPRTRRLVFLLAAALVVAIFAMAAKGPAIVAFLRGEGKDVHEHIGPEPPLPAHEVAGRLRHDAIGLCGQGAWTSCTEKLDDAKRLDPAGESDPEVQRLRGDIDRAAHPPQEPKPNKPSP